MTYQHTMEITLGGTDIAVEFDFSCTPTYPATGPTYSSGGEPGGGGEVEIESATIIIGKERHAAPDWLVNLLAEDDYIIEALAESVEEDDGVDWDAIADARRECAE